MRRRSRIDEPRDLQPRLRYISAGMTSTETTAARIAARGKVLREENGMIVFAPAGTNYELHLQPAGPFHGSIGQLIEAFINVAARKVYTVSTGGNFIQPIFGTPRIIQGRVLALDERRLIVHAGAAIGVDLPSESHAIDLNRGPIARGSMVNVVASPGGSIEFPSRA